MPEKLAELRAQTDHLPANLGELNDVEDTAWAIDDRVTGLEMALKAIMTALCQAGAVHPERLRRSLQQARTAVAATPDPRQRAAALAPIDALLGHCDDLG